MGWLFMRDCGRFSGPRAYLDDQFTYVRDDHRLTVLRSALVAFRTYYAACEHVTAAGERRVFAVVCLVQYNARASDGVTFGYKDMDESMGPQEADCPASVLDLLTPTDRPYAVEWRKRCREAIAARARASAKPSPRPGQTIIFDHPLTFADGVSRSRFEVVDGSGRRPAVRLRDPVSGSCCRIPNIKRYAYRLVDPVQKPATEEMSHG